MSRGSEGRVRVAAGLVVASALLVGCPRRGPAGTPVESGSGPADATDGTAPAVPSAACSSDAATVDAALEVRNGASGLRAAPRIADYVPSVWLVVTGGAGKIERSLFALPDIEPIDDCHAEVTGAIAAFACARGAHPEARLEATAGRLVLTTARPGAPASAEDLGPGACATVSLRSARTESFAEDLDTTPTRYQQWYPTAARPAGKHGSGFDPFEGVAADHRELIPARASDRCDDAGPGRPPVVTIELLVPRRPSATGVVLSVPSLGLREPLDIGGPGESCEGRVYPRSGIAVVRCYTDTDPGVTQRTVFVEHDELLWRFPYPMHRKADPPPVLLPCHAEVKLAIKP